MRFAAVLVVPGLLALVAFGCNKNSTAPATQPLPAQIGDGQPPTPYTGEFPEGRKVFEANNCARCHAINGQGALAGGPDGPGGPPRGPGGGPGGPGGRGGPGGGMGKGPDLGHVGKDHPTDWLAEHVRNPKAHKPESRMPAFPEAKINAADLKSLADYLASLK